jgi:HMG (high mobility group) box
MLTIKSTDILKQRSFDSFKPRATVGTNSFFEKIVPKELKMEHTPQKTLKRPRCGYTFYCKDNWQQVSTALQSTTSKEIIPVLARQWNNLSDAERAPFNLRAQREKQEFEEKRKQRMQVAAAAK